MLLLQIPELSSPSVLQFPQVNWTEQRPDYIFKVCVCGCARSDEGSAACSIAQPHWKSR